METGQGKQHKILSDIITEVSRVVVGKNDIKEMLLVALLSQGHVLIEGLPGTAKTTLSRTFAQAIGGKFKRLQGTPDMLPADILGFYLYRPDGTSTFMPGPIFANVVMADELNRTTPRTQAALIEAMQEQQVTIEKDTHRLEQPFIVIASQVPYGGAGTSPLTDVQLDRFMFRIWSAFPSVEEEDQVLRNIDRISDTKINSVATLADIVHLQHEVTSVYVADGIRRYIISILDSLRHNQDLLLGPSTRGGIALFKGARALAFIQGRDFVIPDDVKRLLIASLAHRLRITAEAEMDRISPETIVSKAAEQIPVPKEGVASRVENKVSASEFTDIASGSAEETVSSTAAASGAIAEAPAPSAASAGEPVPETVARVEPVPDPPRAVLVAREPIARSLADWQWLIIACASVIAIIMICLGLLSLR